MKKQIQIGHLAFDTKKDALAHFKKILNSYDYGQILNDLDYRDVEELIKTHKRAEEKIGVGIKEIRVEKITYNTRCFQFIRNDLSVEFFSYIKCITGSTPPFTKFSKACRDAVKDDIRNVKQQYFNKFSKKSRVKCQETGELCLWSELTVDHRQPNTFSVIVDRFIEVNKLNVSSIEYVDNDTFGSRFKDDDLTEKFRNYHRDKANLRIVISNKNQGRAHQARINRQKKDLKIE